MKKLTILAAVVIFFTLQAVSADAKSKPRDTVPPVISGLQIQAATSSAAITFDTDEPSKAVLKYSTSPKFLKKMTGNAKGSVREREHEFEISALQASTTYFLLLQATDKAGNVSFATSSFSTAESLDTPEVGITVDIATTTAEFVNIEGPGSNQAWFTIVLDIKAVGGDVYIDKTITGTTSTSSLPIGHHRAAAITTNQTVDSLEGLEFYASDGNSSELSHTFLIEEGNTARFTARVITGGNANSKHVVLFGLEWGVADIPVGTHVYTQGMGIGSIYTTGDIFVD